MKQESNAAPLVVMTIGHSTRPIDEFIHLLRSHGVERLVDVRTVPRSRHNPQFNRDALSHSLHAAHIHYTYMPGLGGFRRARKAVPVDVVEANSLPSASMQKNSSAIHSLNAGWRNASFRGYADYMQTAEFEQHLEKLIELTRIERVAIMCAEAVPWRCHRSLIADALTVRGIEAREITSVHGERLHALTPFAQVHGIQLSYPAQDAPPADATAPKLS
jgi:uncharacterized protein (DUF488 family)